MRVFQDTSIRNHRRSPDTCGVSACHDDHGVADRLSDILLLADAPTHQAERAARRFAVRLQRHRQLRATN